MKTQIFTMLFAGDVSAAVDPKTLILPCTVAFLLIEPHLYNYWIEAVPYRFRTKRNLARVTWQHPLFTCFAVEEPTPHNFTWL